MLPTKLAVPKLGAIDPNPIKEFPTPRNYEPEKPRNSRIPPKKEYKNIELMENFP